MAEKLIEEIERRLNAKTIHDIRQIARAVGVPRPADGRKERILDCIMKIASGESDPAVPSVRGAHPKSTEYDRQIVSDILRCREICLSANGGDEREKTYIGVSSGAGFDPLDFTAEGLLCRSDGKWFLRVFGKGGSCGDVFVNDFFVNNFSLREGDSVYGNCKRSNEDELAGLAGIISVNGVSPEDTGGRTHFNNLIPIYPDKILRLAHGGDIVGRMIDMFAPLGAGQRAFITAPHGAGKTALLKRIAAALKNCDKDIATVIALVDARPEEAADFQRTFSGGVFASTFDEGAQNAVDTALLALEHCKRLVEQKKDAVLILDDITRLARAYNSCGRQVASALDTSALDGVKRYLAAARNTEGGGSLTVISALTDGGDGIDGAVRSGLINLCGMRISLSAELAKARVYPPLDLQNTYSSVSDTLLSSAEHKTAEALRGMRTEEVINLFSQTRDNAALCEELSR